MWDDIAVYYGCCRGCGCQLCTGQYHRIRDTRRHRHAVRQALHVIRLGAEETFRHEIVADDRRRDYW